MIDEEKAREEEAAHENMEQKLERLDKTLSVISEGLGGVMADYASFQNKIKSRVATIENKTKVEK